MPWKYILSVRLDDNVIYKRDLYEDEICIQNKEKELGYKNDINYELLPHGGDE